MKVICDEIGGDFCAVPTAEQDNGLFAENTRWFLSGRSALSGVISQMQQQYGVRTVAMPAWCCESMIKPFADVGIEVRFYPVYSENGRLVQRPDAVQPCDALFLMDYFGYAAGSVRPDVPGVRVRDLTHSVFSGVCTDAQYYFGSLRKWAGFHTGGFAVGVDAPVLAASDEYTALRMDAMAKKEQYLSGAREDKAHLQIFHEAEEMLERPGVFSATQRDVALAQKMDVSAMKQRRRENAALLLKELSDVALFPDLGEQDCPLFVPILVPDGKRDALRRYLIENRIYCPVHWPLTARHCVDEKTAALYSDSLSLVCDQRYSAQDMQRIVETVANFWKA